MTLGIHYLVTSGIHYLVSLGAWGIIFCTYGRTQNLSSLFIKAIVTQVQHFKIFIGLQEKNENIIPRRKLGLAIVCLT